MRLFDRFPHYCVKMINTELQSAVHWFFDPNLSQPYSRNGIEKKKSKKMCQTVKMAKNESQQKTNTKQNTFDVCN